MTKPLLVVAAVLAAAARLAGARLRLKPYHASLGKVAVLGDPLGTRFAIIDPALANDWDYSSGADDPYDD